MKLGVCYYPEHWPQDMWAQDARDMVDAGITKVRIAEFAWSRIEPNPGEFDWGWLDKAVETLAEVGLEITMCTPTATPPKWLIDKHPEILAWDETGHPRTFGSRRHYCFSSDIYRKESQRISKAVIERYAHNPAVTSWQTDNEYGCHNTVRSYSPNAKHAFRDWLEKRYKTIQALNTAWGTVFWSQEYRTFDEIDLPNLTVTEPNPAHVLDFNRFSSDQVIAFNREQVNIIRANTKADITHNVMGHFTRFDHYKLGKDLDITTWDSYPLGFLDQGWWTDAQKQRWMRAGHPDFAAFHHALYRSCSGGPRKGRWGVMEQQPGPVNWAPNNPAPRDGMVALWTLEACAMGAEYVSYFRWRQAPFAQEQNHAGLRDHRNAVAHAEVEAKGLGNFLGALGEQMAAHNKVALVFDYESAWIYDIQPQSAYWNYEALCFEFYTVLRRMGLSVDIISPHHDLTGYEVIVVPSQPIIPDGFLDRAKQAKAHIVFGPRSGSKTTDYHSPKTDPIPKVTITRCESVRDSHIFDIEMDEQFYQGRIWRDYIKTDLNVEAVCHDGVPAFVTGQDYSILTVVPNTKFLRAILSHVFKEQNLETTWLSKDIRIERTQSHGFAFNYGPKTVTIRDDFVTGKFIQGGRSLPPAGVSVWKL